MSGYEFGREVTVKLPEPNHRWLDHGECLWNEPQGHNLRKPLGVKAHQADGKDGDLGQVIVTNVPVAFTPEAVKRFAARLLAAADYAEGGEA